VVVLEACQIDFARHSQESEHHADGAATESLPYCRADYL
jgi:hypothetical protein